MFARAIALPDDWIAERAAHTGDAWAGTGYPVEYLSLGGIGPGVPVRATVSDFGPQLLAKVLGANETQESSLGLVFHYADTKGLPLLDLGDLRALLHEYNVERRVENHSPQMWTPEKLMSRGSRSHKSRRVSGRCRSGPAAMTPSAGCWKSCWHCRFSPLPRLKASAGNCSVQSGWKAI